MAVHEDQGRAAEVAPAASAPLKVFIAPTFHNADRAEGGIRRVSEALWRYLPQFGVTPVDNPLEADLLNCHGASRFDRLGVPLVASNHGLYWDDYPWAAWAHDTNRQVVDLLARAQAVTAPSKWVAQAITRGMLITPTVIYHGVDPDEWAHSEPAGNYVLWNKARSDPVSNPGDMQTLALAMPDVRFVTTIGQPFGNVEVCGVLPSEEMKPLIQRAGVYLATARETMGIGTLEALACGVPVAGWDYGGQSEIILDGQTGYLAPYGDYKALVVAVRRCLADRERLGRNAIDDVRARWLWPDKVEQYAALFKQVAAVWNTPRPKVSVIVTCHNLAQYLPDALRSVQAQTMPDWECIVVDDASSDNTAEVVERGSWDARIVYRRTPENLKLSGARNFGFSHARGKYVIYLDADDQLAPDALATLSAALDADPGLHIASGHLDTVNDAGGDRQRSSGWPVPAFDFHQQLAHMNQMTYSAMLRREVLERGGGYRRRAWRAEDAEMWCRLTSFGFRAAKVTEAATLVYRWRSDSKSQQEMHAHPDRDGDWTAWFPWRLAGTGKEGSALIKRGARTPAPLTPWGAQGEPPPGTRFWPVPHHQSPLVSVIIPVGPGHEKTVIDAVESVMGQTFRSWEVIVVNDTGAPWPEGFDSPVCGAPYAQVLQPGKVREPRGAGAARNAGASIARGHVLVFLDADDILLPEFLSATVPEWQRTGRLIYTDYLVSRGQATQPPEQYETEDWECSRYVEREGKPQLVGVLNRMQHAVTCLVPRQAFDACGGMSADMEGWEDWDFFIRLAATGLCSVRVARPLFLYRVQHGRRRAHSQANNDALRRRLYDTWRPYYQGENEMPCGSCPDGAAYTPPPASFAGGDDTPADAVLVDYLGNQVGTFTVVGQATGSQYRFGATEQHVRKYVRAGDVEGLLAINISGQPQFKLASAPLIAPQNPITAEPAGRPALPDMSEYARLPQRAPQHVEVPSAPAQSG